MSSAPRRRPAGKLQPAAAPDAPEPPPGGVPAHPAMQARSRATLARLLDAAEGVLAAGGLEAATVPGIAAAAGLSVGVVYRRFPDKDALLRAAYERFFARSAEGNRAALAPARWAGAPLAAVVGAVVAGMARGYREHRGLLRALVLYARTHPDPAFRARAETLNAEALAGLAELVLARRVEIAHPDPAGAARLGLVVVACALHELVLMGTRVPGADVVPNDAALAEELTRLYLGYLGAPAADGATR